MIGARYAEAVRLAVHAHGDQVRKGTDIAYVSHPIAVSALAIQFGADEDQAIIAVSHDMVEDCGAGWAHRLREAFGDRVAEGVLGCSDRGPGIAPHPDWRSRKMAYVEHLSTASNDVLLVSLCDKLHNASCIVADLEADGVSVFDRFTGRKDGTLWYYNILLAAFRSRRVLPKRAVAQFAAMVHRMNALAVPASHPRFDYLSRLPL